MFSTAFIILLLQSNLGLSGDHPIDVEGRIVGGVEVKPVHKYPFQVTLLPIALNNQKKIPLHIGIHLCWWICLRRKHS